MALTYQTLVDEVRRLARDRQSPYRYSDTDIALLITGFLVELQRIRPDAFLPYDFGESPVVSTPEVTPATFGDPWPVDQQFLKAGILHVFGYIELADDEHANSGRANAALTQSHNLLVGVQ